MVKCTRRALLAYGVCGATLPLALSARDALADATVTKNVHYLILKDQGTFYVGGEIEFRDPNTSRTTPDPKSLPGNIAVHQMYVEYQVPADQKYPYPIVLVHGAGHTGQHFRTTPDGRQGWFTSFARRGFAVYAVDAANHGRAGWDPTNRFAVSQGFLPHTALEPGSIYSEQSAWTAFRWGSAPGTPFPNTQFPIDHVDVYLKQIQPSYRDAATNGRVQANLAALIDKIGPCILLGWSSGTGNVMVAGTSSPERMQAVKGIIGIEGYPGAVGNRPPDTLAAQIPFLGLAGDFQSPELYETYAAHLRSLGGDATSVFLPDVEIFGNGHTMAVERNNEQTADIIERWIQEHISGNAMGRADLTPPR